MSDIHTAILEHVRSALQVSLIDNVPADDKARAGVVAIGPTQGEPDPESARITVTIHENDPDAIIKSGSTGITDDWPDEVEMIEMGGGITHVRRFSVKARCLLVNSAESASEARSLAGTLMGRIESTLLHLSFSSITDADEYVARGILADEFASEMLQAGGPGAYDYYLKVRFSILSTRTGVIQ